MAQDISLALFNGYLALVRVLHRNGTIHAADLANELGNTMDFRRTRKLESAEDHELLEVLYKAVLELEQQELRHAELQAQIDAVRRSKPPAAQ